ncbi:carotenoid 1,2-hydratase [Vibrio cholerae]
MTQGRVLNRSAIMAVGLVVAGLIALLIIFRETPSEEPNDFDSMNDMLRAQKRQVFEPVLPNYPVILPNDFSFNNEYQHGWWQFFANVQDEAGTEYGIQWSFIRIASHDQPLRGWLSPQVYVSHLVVSSQYGVWKEQRVARGGIGQAEMTSQPFRMWIDNWNWRSLGRTPFPGMLTAQTDEFSVQLSASTNGPFVLPGERGYVAKHDLLPIASYNIFAPFLNVQGSITLPGDRQIKVDGKAWMSKEWGSGLLAEGQQGWDWFVVHLDDETTLSVSRYRQNKQLPYWFGTLSSNDGKVINLADSDLVITPNAPSLVARGKRVPMSWTLEVPAHNIHLTVSATNQNLWLPFFVPYWEGPIKTTGSHKAQGFMQLIGY